MQRFKNPTIAVQHHAWRGGAAGCMGVELVIKRPWFRLPAWQRLRNDSGHVVYILVPYHQAV